MTWSTLVCIGVLTCATAWLPLCLADECSEEGISCGSCVRRQSWWSNCRWCPVDGQCHAAGSQYSACNSSQQILTSDNCPSFTAQYDPHLAWLSWVLSLSAYQTREGGAAPQIQHAIDTFAEPGLVINISSFTAAAPPSKDAFSGYVAAVPRIKALVVVFRGTRDMKQLERELTTVLHEKIAFLGGGYVEKFFHDAYTSVWENLSGELEKLRSKYPRYERLLFTGHSLGAALASLGSTEYVVASHATNHSTMPTVSLYTFGQPRVGDYGYAANHDQAVPDSWRITHRYDVVVHVPTCYSVIGVTPCSSEMYSPYHHGIEVFYPNDMAINDTYSLCSGFPYTEGDDCADSISVWDHCLGLFQGICIRDHSTYFNFHANASRLTCDLNCRQQRDAHLPFLN